MGWCLLWFPKMCFEVFFSETMLVANLFLEKLQSLHFTQQGLQPLSTFYGLPIKLIFVGVIV